MSGTITGSLNICRTFSYYFNSRISSEKLCWPSVKHVSNDMIRKSLVIKREVGVNCNLIMISGYPLSTYLSLTYPMPITNICLCPEIMMLEAN